ncbi:MAG: helix-turn-helix domain-containing protein [Christensenellaceae bacterium]
MTNDEDFIPLLSEILLHFAQRVKEASRRAPLEQTSPYIKRSVKYILLHLHSPIRLEEVSREVGLEPKYFSRLFVSLTGETFSSFVQRERVLEAKELLEITIDNGRDQQGLGLSSPSYFIKVFNRYVGETPGMYAEKKRRRNGQREEEEKL